MDTADKVSLILFLLLALIGGLIWFFFRWQPLLLKADDAVTRAQSLESKVEGIIGR